MATILFVSYEIHPTTMGGCGVLIHHAASALLAEGHDVVLLLDVSEYFFRKFVDHDRLAFPHPERIRACRVDDLCADFTLPRDAVPCIFQWKSLRFAHAQRKVAAEVRPDFVEYFDYCGPGYYAFAQRLFADADEQQPVLGCRVHGSIEVLDRHGAGLVGDFDKFLLHSFERRALTLAETVLVPTRTYYERYYRDLYSLAPERVVVSAPPKQPFVPVRRRPAPGEPFSVMFLGRMFHLKGVDQLVHAGVMLLKRRPDLNCTFELLGYDSEESPVPGSYVAYLRTLIPTRLRERFVFPGQQSHAEIARRLERTLFAVFPNRTESFCYALHEVYDAGVPVIVNNLPAFADFFHDGRNALVYDSTTHGLLRAMERMIDEPVLRERLCRPFPVAEQPVTDFYARPRSLAPLVPPRGTDPCPAGMPTPLVVVLCHRDDVGSQPAAAMLRSLTPGAGRAICLVPTDPDGEETLWWLGRPWHVRSIEGAPIEPSDILTTDAISLLAGDDRPAPGWIDLCLRALSRRGIAFAGTWTTRAGRCVPELIDVAPELGAFRDPGSLRRLIVRTTPGIPLSDVFDASLGPLGHMGLIWSAVARFGHGVLLPLPMLDEGSLRLSEPDPANVRSLILRFGEPFAERLAQVAGLLTDTRGPGAPDHQPTVEAKVRIADELGGRTLARLAMKKLARRLQGN